MRCSSVIAPRFLLTRRSPLFFEDKMGIVVFSPEVFRTNHPFFADEVTYSDEYLSECFDIAADLVGNADASIVPYDPENAVLDRERILDLATCHIATLMSWPEGQSGRIASASQGSVSTSFDLVKTRSATGDWWNQTQCGALYWLLMSKYRTGGRFYGVRSYHPWG